MHGLHLLYRSSPPLETSIRACDQGVTEAQPKQWATDNYCCPGDSRDDIPQPLKACRPGQSPRGEPIVDKPPQDRIQACIGTICNDGRHIRAEVAGAEQPKPPSKNHAVSIFPATSLVAPGLPSKPLPSRALQRCLRW